MRIAMRFDGFRGRYLIHCHNLEHENHSIDGAVRCRVMRTSPWIDRFLQFDACRARIVGPRPDVIHSRSDTFRVMRQRPLESGAQTVR